MFVYVTSFFNLCHVRNTGAAFSFLGEAGGWQILVFAGLAAVVSAVCVWLIWRNARRTLFSASLALIVSGAVGNLWDRLVYGYVTDFLDFHAFGWHWPSFNVADICICVGAVLLVFDATQPPTPVGLCIIPRDTKFFTDSRCPLLVRSDRTTNG